MGSADHNVHLYDLRKADAPTHVFSGEHAQQITTFMHTCAHLSATVHFRTLPCKLAESECCRALRVYGKSMEEPCLPHAHCCSILPRQRVSAAGHRKAVSYVRWLGEGEVVSASTDSTLRLWDLASGRESRVFRGHVNEKNFVGLAADSEFIACGSETNEVRCMPEAWPPVLSAGQSWLATCTVRMFSKPRD